MSEEVRLIPIQSATMGGQSVNLIPVDEEDELKPEEILRPIGEEERRQITHAAGLGRGGRISPAKTWEEEQERMQVPERAAEGFYEKKWRLNLIPSLDLGAPALQRQTDWQVEQQKKMLGGTLRSWVQHAVPYDIKKGLVPGVKATGIDVPEPETIEEAFAFGAAGLHGFIKGLPMAMGKALVRPFAPALTDKMINLVGGRVVGKGIADWIIGGQELGFAFVATELDKPKEIHRRWLAGTILGKLFGAVKWIDPKTTKSIPMLNNMVRQTVSRLMGTQTKVYQGGIWKRFVEGLKTGDFKQAFEGIDDQEFFDELMWSYFVWKPANIKQLTQLKKEVKQLPNVEVPKEIERLIEYPPKPRPPKLRGLEGLTKEDILRGYEEVAPEPTPPKPAVERRARGRAEAKGVDLKTLSKPDLIRRRQYLRGLEKDYTKDLAEIDKILKEPRPKEAPAPREALVRGDIEGRISRFQEEVAAIDKLVKPEPPGKKVMRARKKIEKPTVKKKPVAPTLKYKVGDRFTRMGRTYEVTKAEKVGAYGEYTILPVRTGKPGEVIEPQRWGEKKLEELYKPPKKVEVKTVTKDAAKLTKEAIAKDIKRNPKKYENMNAGLNIKQGLRDWARHIDEKYETPEGERYSRAEVDYIADMADKAMKERHWIPAARVLTNLDRMGQYGKNIADKGRDYVKNRAQGEQRDVFLALEAHKALYKEQPRGARARAKLARVTVSADIFNEKIGKKLYDLAEGKTSPETDAERFSRDTIRTLLEDKWTRFKEAGGVTYDISGKAQVDPYIENYMPRVYKNIDKVFDPSFRNISARRARDMLIEMNAKKDFPELYEKNKQEAIELAERAFEDLRIDLSTKKFGHLEMPRLLNEQRLFELEQLWKDRYPNKKFPLERDTSFNSILRYLVGANDRISWIEQFGLETEMREKKGWMVPEGIYENIYKIKSRTNRTYVLNFFRHYLRGSAMLDPRAIRAMRTIRTGQLTKLAFAFVPNSLQWFTNTIPLLTTKEAIMAAFDQAKYAGLGGKEAKTKAREFFSKTGAKAFKDAFNMAAMGDAQRTNQFADITMRLHGFTGTEMFNAMFAASAGAKRALNLSAKLHAKKGKSWRTPFYIAELKKLGLSKADIEFIIKERALTEADVMKLADAAYSMRRGTQFLADAFSLPATWSRPTGRLVTQFKNFAYNQTMLLVREPIMDALRFVKPARKVDGKLKFSLFQEGTPVKFVKAFVNLGIAGALIYNFKKWLFPRLGIHFYEDLMAGKSWPLVYLTYIASAGGFGLATDLITSISYGQLGMAKFIAGPTISNMGEFAEALLKTGGDLFKSIEYTNAKWVTKRAKTVASYWAKFGARLSPDIKLAIAQWTQEYTKLTKANNWANIYRSATTKYKELYILKGPSKAAHFWVAFMETQGKEYKEIFGKTPQKPKPKDIREWWKEKQVAASERMHMPGKVKAPTYYY